VLEGSGHRDHSGNASKITTHVFRIFDSDGNDFLDFKEFLMAIDVANRDTGILMQSGVI
jgi:Ca2+-binding EF-hand superfamily protein